MSRTARELLADLILFVPLGTLCGCVTVAFTLVALGRQDR